ncbi:Glycosyl transferase family 2 [Faunimonas pinastri]|uniref:Glycosyl transferase family 2 n=1 Tax=Faunimonas pinastri TaxID=1855383 RepID=A0A1H9CP29_9HYPH|nr:glycosyltransferase family A protein [Faunimonas pinastri]SEQ02914.1 Glycosyl transferase family 2 [Faunimonas pinastri]
MTELTAILAVRDRPDLLPAILDALAKQSLGRERFEILIVLDGIAETALGDAAGPFRQALRSVRQNRSGLAAARNLAVYLAKAPVLVFLSEQDLPGPDLLLAHLAAHLQYTGENAAVTGQVELRASPATPLLRYLTDVTGELFLSRTAREQASPDNEPLREGRFSCKRAMLIEHGIYHPALHSGADHEELEWRLRSRGLYVVHQPEARTEFAGAVDLDRWCRQAIHEGGAKLRASRLHDSDELRDKLAAERLIDTFRERRLDYASHLRWTRDLDRLATERAAGGLDNSNRLIATLHSAYAKAFELCRGKGAWDAAEEPRLAATDRPGSRRPENYRSLLDFGVRFETPTMP